MQSRVLAVAGVSVRLFVCLSHAGILWHRPCIQDPVVCRRTSSVA